MAKPKRERKRPLYIEGAGSLKLTGDCYLTGFHFRGEYFDRTIRISKPAALALYSALAEAHGHAAPIAAWRSKR